MLMCVCELQQCGKSELVASALHHYKVDIACLQEVRFPDSGSESVLGAGTDSEFTFMHSGCTNGQYGVAIAMKSHFKCIHCRIQSSE
jgi:exonuclease III